VRLNAYVAGLEAQYTDTSADIASQSKGKGFAIDINELKAHMRARFHYFSSVYQLLQKTNKELAYLPQTPLFL